MEVIFIQLAVILLAAFIVSYIVKALKQPIILGYILAGILISPFIVKIGYSGDIVGAFSQLGIAFLLFIVGLHLNPKVIKEVGLPSLIVGLGQIILTFGLGFLISLKILGFSPLTSAYLGIALAFSSTIIVMKLLSDKQHLDSLYGKLTIGILIIQDLVAVAVLMIISSLSEGKFLLTNEISGLVIGIILLVVMFLIGYLALPRILKSVAKSQELLFLFSICWCFLIAALFSYVGFSMEIGALVAGVILSVSPYSTEISSKIRPLRDFFLIIFFIILGLQIQVSNLRSIIVPSLVLSGVALFLKPFIIMFFMKIFGYTKRTNFFTGGILSQISEFSLIVIGLAFSVGHVGFEIVNLVVLTMVITILVSTYWTDYAQRIYQRISKVLIIFEKNKIRKERKVKEKYDAILFGYNRIGFSILNSLKKLKKNYLVVDFNPDTVIDLNKFHIPALYGDAFDLELLEDLPLDKTRLIISTIPDLETNSLLLEAVREINKKSIVILRAHSIEEALELYKKGANYVLTPHFLGGEYVSNMISHFGLDRKDYGIERAKHVKMLNEIKEKGHRHPEIERN